MSRFSDYESSYITPQQTLLEKFMKVLDYLRENPTSKMFYSSQNHNATNLYLSSLQPYNKTVNVCDVVYFNDGYVGIVNSVIATTYSVTTPVSIKGPTGATGPQGPTGATGATGSQGPAGQDGIDALVPLADATDGVIDGGSGVLSFSLNISDFNRTPNSSDHFFCVVIDTNEQKVYFGNATITSLSSLTANCEIANPILIAVLS